MTSSCVEAMFAFAVDDPDDLPELDPALGALGVLDAFFSSSSFLIQQSETSCPRFLQWVHFFLSFSRSQVLPVPALGFPLFPVLAKYAVAVPPDA
jgi:hypothetical protein